MLPMFVAAAAVTTLPLYNVERSCKIDTEAAQDKAAHQEYLKDEEFAKTSLAQERRSYSLAAKETRVPGTRAGQRSDGSYVELMVCFEIQDWKMHLDNVGGAFAAGAGAYGGSPPTPSQVGGYAATHPLGGVPGPAVIVISKIIEPAPAKKRRKLARLTLLLSSQPQWFNRSSDRRRSRDVNGKG
jgi:hypothetical protein